MNEVTTYYLEMKSPSLLKDKKESQELRMQECEIKQFQFDLFLYQLVGEAWEWKDKLPWSNEQWKA